MNLAGYLMQSFLKGIIAFSALGVLGYFIFTGFVANETSKNTSHEQSDTRLDVNKLNIEHSDQLIVDQPTHIGIAHAHGDNKEHSHDSKSESLDQGSDSNSHHDIPRDIKQRLCVSDHHSAQCYINTDIDYVSQLSTKDGNLLADEIGVVMNSDNFQEMLNDLATRKVSNESYEREFKYSDQFTNSVSHSSVKSDGVYCGDSSCGMVIRSNNMGDIEKFNKAFFSDLEKGNLFIVQMPLVAGENITQRIMFFPNNLNPINKRAGKR
jgi:hypothetical protein